MLDYTKIELPFGTGDRLLTHPDLSFSGKFDRSTGAIYSDEPLIANYGPLVVSDATSNRSDPRRALQFIVYPSGRAILGGSWHKYAQGGTNHGDFTLSEFRAAVGEVCKTFALDPFALHLLQCEAGANVQVPGTAADVLHALVCHGPGIDFERHRWFQDRIIARKAIRTEYEVKIYDKGGQYQLDRELLRIEVKFTKARQFQKLNIHTLGDLLHPDAWQRLELRIRDIYDELTIAEPSFDLPNLTASDCMFATLATTAAYWQGLTKEGRYKARNRYTELVEQFAPRNLKAEVRALLSDKFALLRADAGHSFTENRNAPGPLPGSPFHGSVNVGSSDATEPEQAAVAGADGGKDQRSNKGGTPSQPGAVVNSCLTCGRDISDQRAGSRYCSETLYGKEAKRCRNAGSNPRNNLLRSIAHLERDPLLFDQRPFIRPPQHRNTSPRP